MAEIDVLGVGNLHGPGRPTRPLAALLAAVEEGRMPTPGAHAGAGATARRLACGVSVLALVVTACTGGGTTDTHEATGIFDRDGCRSPQPAPSTSQLGTFEDANLIAGGEMFRVYGTDGDPVREQVTGEGVTVGGRPAWKLDATYAVSVDGDRRSDAWMLWVGFADDQLVVLCADGPPDIIWPPPHAP